MSNTIYFVNASVGAGKTAAFVDYVSSGKSKKTIYAAPTAKLASQTHEEIRRKQGKAKLILSPQSMMKLESEADDSVVVKKDGIVDAIDYEIASLMENDEYDTLVISHVALLLYLDADNTSNKSNLKFIELFIDEQLPVFDFLRFTPDENTFDTYLDMMSNEHIVDNVHRLRRKLECEDEYEPIIRQIHNRNNLNTKQFAQILKSLKKRTSAVFADISVDSLQTVTLVDPASFTKRFKKTTVLCADFSNTLQYHIFKEVFGIEFIEEASLAAMVQADTHTHGSMLKLYYLVEGGKKASKSMLIDSRGESRQVERDLLFEQVGEFWPDGNFIYSTHASWTHNKNGKVRTLDKLDNVKSVGVKSHGQNQYTEFHRVAALTVCQFPNSAKSILSKLSNKDPNDLNVAFKVESVYQCVGRTAIRDHQFLSGTEGVEAIVLDRETADKIAEIFKGAEVVGRIGNFEKQRRVRSDATGVPKAVLNYLGKRKMLYMTEKVSPKQKRTIDTIKKHIKEYPQSNYTLSDFGL